MAISYDKQMWIGICGIGTTFIVFKLQIDLKITQFIALVILS
jgi:hypothetical protein